MRCKLADSLRSQRGCVAAYSKAPAVLLSTALLKVCVIMDGLMGRSVTGGGRWPLSSAQLPGFTVENTYVPEGWKRGACPGVETLQHDVKWSLSQSICAKMKDLGLKEILLLSSEK